MRRADRLFQIVQHLRGRRLTTAAQLASRLQTSTRTIYRDIRDLSLSGVPIEGEAGVGYRLAKGFEIPPLMFDFTELQALSAGLRFVRAWGGPELHVAAESALSKIRHVIPPQRIAALDQSPLHFPHAPGDKAAAHRLDVLRRAIEQREVVTCHYRDGASRESSRHLRPLGVFYWGNVWTLLAWCEARDDFRNFRLDRIVEITPTGRKFNPTRGQTLEDFYAKLNIPR
jgi:predicted DNA-binding transcriptional regulator YafY